MESSIWHQCLQRLRDEISQSQFNQWISPLQVEQTPDELCLYAPNQYVLDGVSEKYFGVIERVLASLNLTDAPKVVLRVGAKNAPPLLEPIGRALSPAIGLKGYEEMLALSLATESSSLCESNLNPSFNFDNYVEGKSNQLARAAAIQVAENPGSAYNPLFLYGGVGLGKTHLMHAVGNIITQKRPGARVVYLHAERFVADMIKALQTNSIEEFKEQYRSVDVLLIDDIQFFAGKERSQEEFFHTFNALLEADQQMIITSDRYPREINGIEERLKSRFGSGLTVAVQPPELETRVAIIMNKAQTYHIELAPEVAFFIAKRVRSNVREMEGALKRVIANAHFTNSRITLSFAQDALKDLIALQDKLVSIDNIIRTVGEYYKIRLSELLSKKRNRAIARPRQVAMALCKELTAHSLPEIGDAFGGRDHTTVLHACRQVKHLVATGTEFAEDFSNLLRILSA